MTKICLIPIMLASVALGQEVLEQAAKIAQKDTGKSWPAFVKSCENNYAQFEKDNQSATKNRYLDDKLGEIEREFRGARTIGNLKRIIMWLGLYHEWKQILPPDWEKALKPYLEELKALPEEIDWQDFLSKVKARLHE